MLKKTRKRTLVFTNSITSLYVNKIYIYIDGKSSARVLCIRLACLCRFVREFLEGFLVDAITHAFVCASHAEPKCCIRQFQASEKHMVAATAAVEHLLAQVWFLRFVFFFWWQQDGGCITTQHWEVLIAEIFVCVLVERKRYIVSVI